MEEKSPYRYAAKNLGDKLRIKRAEGHRSKLTELKRKMMNVPRVKK